MAVAAGKITVYVLYVRARVSSFSPQVTPATRCSRRKRRFPHFLAGARAIDRIHIQTQLFKRTQESKRDDTICEKQVHPARRIPVLLVENCIYGARGTNQCSKQKGVRMK